MEIYLRHFQFSNPEVSHLRILVHGHTAAGISSFVNSVDSAFKHRITIRAPTAPKTMPVCTKMVNIPFDLILFISLRIFCPTPFYNIVSVQ